MKVELSHERVARRVNDRHRQKPDHRLCELIPDLAEAARILRHHTRSLRGFVPLDEAATLAAMKIRHAGPSRLPLVNALIAACAASHRLTLVPRDRHMEAIPAGQVAMLRRPDRQSG